MEEHNRQLESQLHKLKGILEVWAKNIDHQDQILIIQSCCKLLQPGGTPGNKTGTLNTKSVTASMLATDSPILPHKVNGSYTQQVKQKQNLRTLFPCFFIMKRNLRKQNRTENKAVESDLLGFIRRKTLSASSYRPFG